MNVRRFACVFVLCAAVAAGAVHAQAPASLPSPADVIRSVQARLAPDRRVAVFDVTAEQTPQGLVVTGTTEHADWKHEVLSALRTAGYGQLVETVSVLPDPSLGAGRLGIVRVSVANVRSRPSHPAELATQAVMGWTVQVLKRQSGWYYVHTDPDNYLGWIEELQLTLVDEDARRAWTSGPRVVVTVPVTFVRERAVAGATPVTDVVVGAILRRTGSQDGWIAVSLPDGRSGYLRSDEAEDAQSWLTSRRATPDTVERTALQFMGVPYLWGGTSSKGFDCSGYAKTVLRLNGVELPRDTDQQAGTGMAVAIDDGLTQLRKGDLVFFGTRATPDQPERISHVGIYVGNGEILHASGLVRRNSLLPASPIYSESLRNRMLRVRRVLP